MVTLKDILSGVFYSTENCCTLSEDGVWSDCDEPVNWELDKNGEPVGRCDDGHEVKASQFVKNLPMFLASDGKKAPCPKIFDPLWLPNGMLGMQD